jgi:hypothetical protein
MDNEELDELLLKRQIECLKKGSPEDWHRVAFHYNWDEPLYLLYWIVSQPECEKATALAVFWNGEPTCYDFEDDTQVMGEDPYAVEPLLKYIVRRFNTTGYQRSDIAFDLLEARGCNMPEYHAMDIEGKERDFAELIDRQKDIADPLLHVPASMMVFSTPGRKVNIYEESDFFETYPYTISYETGELLYPDPPEATEQRNGAHLAVSHDDASGRMRSLRQKLNLAPSGDEDHASSWHAVASKAPKTKLGFFHLDCEESWFVFHIMTMGYIMIALLAFTSEKFYTTIGWVGALLIMLWALWSAFSSFRSVKDAITSSGSITAIALGIISGVFLSVPGYAFLVVLKASFGTTIASLIALVILLPLQWIISGIFAMAYLKPAK